MYSLQLPSSSQDLPNYLPCHNPLPVGTLIVTYLGHVPRSATYTAAIHSSQLCPTPDAPPSIRSRSNRLFAGHVADALAHYLKNQPTVHRQISRLYSCNPASHVA